jgi:group I intron endonuclease
MYQVYQIENTNNNMYYVGLHNGDIFNNSYYGSGRLITRAVKKYGKDIFDRQVITEFESEEIAKWFEQCVVGIDVAKDDMSYNLVVGGGGYASGESHPMYGTKRPKRSKEWREKLSLAHSGDNGYFYGKKRPKQSKRMMGDNNPMKREDVNDKLRGKNNPMFGVPSVWRGKKRPEHSKIMSKEVLKFDLEGNLICSYPSITIAAKENNISSASISYTCSVRYNKACGYIWKYKNNNT